MSSQLYLALSLQIEADTSAYVKIMSVADSNGLEAWRLLKRFYEPKTRGRQRHRMDELLRPKPAEQLAETETTIERWEKEVKDYESTLGSGSTRRS